MRVLLVNPLCRLPFMLPLGLGYIASVLREDGHDVSILDINGYGYSEDKVKESLKAMECDIVGIGGLSSTYKYVKWLAFVSRELKPGVPIVAGNMVSTSAPELLLKNTDVDIAVIDEGEETFKELVRGFGRSSSPDNINGIVFKDRGRMVRTPPRDRIKDLDSLPFPAWDLFPMDIYLNNSTQSRASFGLRSINVSTVRGCPYDCVFCSRPFGRKVYARSAQSIISEIAELKGRYGVGFIDFSDDLFLFNEKRVLDFCDNAVSSGLGVRWSASARVNLVNENLLKNMHAAGCVELSYGFESGNQEMLDRLNKGVTIEQAKEAIAATRKAGINVTGSFIFGMPGETESTIRDTLAFIKDTRLPTYRFFYATPYPGTKLYEIAKSMGRLPRDEDKYMELLGEMRTTFLVNLTGFSDFDLVRLKDEAEVSAKKNLSVGLKMEIFAEDWQRRYVIFRQDIAKYGFLDAIKMAVSKAISKLTGRKAKTAP
jgi:radical SAM superfamily enzyme YgiQ (UPF0313 family)